MKEKCAHVKPDGTRCGAWSMHDSEFCYFHSGVDIKALAAAGGRRSKAVDPLPPTVMPDVELEQLDDLDMIIPVFQRAIEQLETMKPTPQTLATLGNVASAYDRAIDRRASRGADVTRIEVVYVNDWRKN